MAQATIADMIAGAIGARFSGGWWRASTAHCHGGDSPGGLAFRSPDDDPERLIVHCHTHNCHESAEGRNRARDNLRAAAGLPEWRPGNPLRDAQGPFQAQHRGKTPFERPIGAGKGAESRSERTSAPDRVGKNDYAARLWDQAAVSTGQAPPEHPVSRWLARRDLWPPAARLPRGPAVHAESPAAGALVLAMRPLGEPGAVVKKVQLVAITADGENAEHWEGGGKRTYGSGPAVGMLAREPGWAHDPHVRELHACEGLADGLRILRYAPDAAIVAICAGTAGYGALEGWEGWIGRLILYPDADAAGIAAAERAGQRWANRGLSVQIHRLPAGHDPASAPLQGGKE